MALNIYNRIIPTRVKSAMIAMLVALLVLPTGCAKIRLLTYPNQFVWLDSQDVTVAMQAMYMSMERLDALLETEYDSNKPGNQTDLQYAVVNELGTLETIANSILTESATTVDEETNLPLTNHLLLDEHMDEFIDQLNSARFRAEASPPVYYKVGQLVGECNACHRRR